MPAPPRYVLALDQGTSSSRSIVFDRDGRVVSVAQQAFAQHFPALGWVEHEPEDLWTSQLVTARSALQQAGIAPSQVAAVGLTNQRETTLLWNRRTGVPVHRALVWQDRRTEPLCARWRDQGLEDMVRQRTGLRLDPYFSASKLVWLLDHVPGARQAAAAGDLAFGTVDTWLLWRLTGGRVHATDPTNASRTLLFNLHTRQWDESLLQAFGVPESVLPQVHPSGADHGHTQAEWLGASLPVAALVGDQQGALVGQACQRAGLAKNTYGTGCFLLMHTGANALPSASGLLTTAAASLAGGPPQFALEGSVFMGGAVVQWLRDGLGLIRESHEVQALAAQVPDSDGVVLVPAFTGLGAPYWRPDAQGALVGLTRGTRAAHIARAALEAIAFQSAAVLNAMSLDAQAHGATPLRELRVDGGASTNDLLMQIQADVLGLPVVRPRVTETTAWGAAVLAGLYTGVWAAPAGPGPDAGFEPPATANLPWAAERVFEPSRSRDWAAERMARWAHAVRQATAD